MKKHIAEELPTRQFKPAAGVVNKPEGGKDEKDAKNPEDKAKQAVYDIRYRARREEIPLQQAYSQYMQNSSLGNSERMIIKSKLFGKNVSEDFEIEEFASSSIANALYKVFVEKDNELEDEEKLLNYYREEVITNKKGERKYKVEVIGKDGRSYVRYATREKINDLRSNPNIKSVEMTDYGTPYEGERKRGSLTAKAKAGKDWDGDGKVESSSKEHAGVVHNAIQRAKGGVPDGRDTRKESVEFIDEVKKSKNKRSEKIDIMKGKNTVKVGPTDAGQNIMAGYGYDNLIVTESELASGHLKFIKMLQEKAVSQNQQQLAGMALSYLRGEMPDASDEVKQMSKMGEQKLRDFAKTEHEGLPEKVGESKCDGNPPKDEGGDNRDEYAKKNVIKNRIRAALGIKNPIVMTAGYEPEGGQIDEVLGGQSGDGYIGHPRLGIKNPLSPPKKSSSAPKTAPQNTGIAGRLGNRASQMDAAIQQLRQSYQPEGDLVSEEEYDRDRDEEQETYGVQGGKRKSSRNPRSAGRVERAKREKRKSMENDPRYGSVKDDRTDKEKEDESNYWSSVQGR